MAETMMSSLVSTHEKRREQMKSALTALGDTEHQVASRLRRQNIRGERGSACGCPIAVYLAQVLDIPVRVQGIEARTRDVLQTQVLLPESVRSFVDAFDHGHFPSLEK